MPNLLPALWPISHVATAVFSNKSPPKPQATAYLDIIGNVMAFAGALRSFAMAYACIYYLYDGASYPAFGSAATLEFSWMWPILVRNLVGTWVICGLWDWFLYFSPLKQKLHKYKMNPVYPSFSQIKHDALWTTQASMCAAVLEIGLCHFWATGVLPMQRDLSETPISNILWIIFITHWRIPHFYVIHRAMHPWKINGIPDIGKFLYKQVHALHHKSYNPTAFSGTNMHTVEATAYYSACLIAVPFGCHPAIVLGCIVDCGVGAWLGHDGFHWPGSGDYFHELHHAHFDCNYGAQHVPIDYLLGTYAGCKEDIRKIWGKKKAGAEANETTVHTQSASKSGVA